MPSLVSGEAASTLAKPKSRRRTPPEWRTENILGFEIAVHDAPVVRRLERVDDGVEQLEQLKHREPLAFGLELGDVIVEIVPYQQLHHEIESPFDGGAQAIHANRASASEGGHDLRLAKHANVVLGVARHAIVQKLDGNLGAIFAVERAVHDAVPSAPDDVE